MLGRMSCTAKISVRHIGRRGLDQLWVADIYLHLAEEFGHLAVILDAFSRKVVGWALQEHLRAELAISALTKAITARQPKPGAHQAHHPLVVGLPAFTPQKSADPSVAIVAMPL